MVVFAVTSFLNGPYAVVNHSLRWLNDYVPDYESVLR